MRLTPAFFLLFIAGCAGQNGAAPIVPVPQTPVEACAAYETSVTRAVVARRIETGQIPQSRAAEYVRLDAQLKDYCAALDDVPDADVMAVYRALLVQLALLASDRVG